MLQIVFTEQKDAEKLKEQFFKKYIQAYVKEVAFQNKKKFMVYSETASISEEKVLLTFIEFVKKWKRTEWARSILQQQFFYHDEEECQSILEIVSEMFDGQRRELTELLDDFQEDRFLKEAFFSFRNHEGIISFDSFVTFRLKPYYKRILNYIEISIDEYKMEQDYQIFIHMLRELLKKRNHKASILHVIVEGRKVSFYNSKFHLLSQNDPMGLIDQEILIHRPLSIDSFTLAPLLSISPKTLCIYTDNEELGLVQTICNIFEERVQLFSTATFWKQKRGTFSRNAANE